MPLEDVLLTKSYKDGKVLFEKNLDDWRLKAQEGFANVNLNLTQLIRDTFSAGYVFDNDGFANKATSLEDRLNAFEQGGADINGTASDTFTINSDGNGATISTSGLTNTHTYTFPDLDGEFLTTTGVQSVSGAKTFTATTLKVAGGDVGVASLSFGAEATSRSFIIPAGNDDVFMTRKSAYLAGAGAGLGLMIYANSATSRTLTVPDPGASAHFIMSEGNQTINGDKKFLGRIDFDADDNSSIRGSADNEITIEIGGSDSFLFSSAGIKLPLNDPPTNLFASRESFVAGRVFYNDGTSAISNDFNIDSIGDNDGDGEYFVNWDNDPATYSCSVTPFVTGGFTATIELQSSTQAIIYFVNTSTNTAQDTSFNCTAFGIL